MAEYGVFNNSGAYIEVNNNNTEFDVVASFLHEKMHQVLASSSTIGALDFLLMNIYKVEKNEKVRQTVKELQKRVSATSIKVQECTAVFDELVFLKSFCEEVYCKTLNMYITEKKYMKEYGFENLRFLLAKVGDDSSLNITNILNITRNIQNIAIKAMNVDVYKITPLDGKYLKCLEQNNKEYNSNHRFMQVIKKIKEDNLSICECLPDEEIDELFRACDLDVFSQFDWEQFSKWAKSSILEPLSLSDMSDYVNYCSDVKPEDYLALANVYNSMRGFKGEFLTSIEEVDSAWTEEDIMYIEAKDNRTLHALINVKNMTQKAFYGENVFLNLGKRVKMIFMDRNHYSETINQCYDLLCCDIFVDMVSVDPYFEEFVNKESVVDYYLKELNDMFCVIFMRGSFRTVFFLMYPFCFLTFFVEKYAKDWSLQKEWWNDDFIDQKKMEEFCEFIKLSENE